MKRFNNLNFRQKIAKRIFTKTDVPIVVYLSVVIAMVLSWRVRVKYDIAQDFFVELFGVAFTMFIIDVLLVSSKSKRWKVVQEDIDYLIARGVNRLRDGIATRAFMFDPDFSQEQSIGDQRAQLLNDLEVKIVSELKLDIVDAELFTADSYAFFRERAEDIWSIINMKYSEFLPPLLVSQLINLHVHLKDLCSHINIYRKSEKNVEDANRFKEIAKEGAGFSLKHIIILVNKLKNEGYSEPARKAENS